MAGDLGRQEHAPGGRRRGGRILSAAAALLLLGGASAVAVGVADQDATPPAPSPSAAAPSPLASDPAPASPVPASAEPPAGPPPAAPSPAGPAPAGPAATEAPLPTELRIPSIGVRSRLLTVGLRDDGTLEVPQPGPDYDRAAWYDGSPRPGSVGPAVIEGHVDSAANGPSVFYRLGALAPGDTADVMRADGSVVTFVVDAVRSYAKDEFPTLEVYGNTDTSQLRLITCGGDFDRSSGHYEDNTVAFLSLA
jgi:hypothetical protein